MNLHELLDQGVHDDAEHGDGLANHLPMVLVALQALGASDARMHSFAASYRTRLRPARPAEAWPSGDGWRSRFGQIEAWSAYRDLFAQWLIHEGRDAVLDQTLPGLMPGCGGAAFHGLIRTALAVVGGHDGELADALAYWACRHLTLGAALPAAGAQQPSSARETDPQSVLHSLWRDLAGWHPAHGLIVQRMQAAAQQPAFTAHVSRLAIGDGTLPALSRLVAHLYARSGNFTVLHLVTSAHAMRLLLPRLDEPLPAIRSYWLACAAGAATVPALAGLGVDMPPTPLDWSEITARAIASDDEHVIKLVYSCREEERCHGGAEYREAAARAVTAP